MSERSNFVFKALNVISWIIFVGLCIEAGALLVNFIYSLFKPEIISHLYQKLDLSQMYSLNKWAYFGMYSFILFISILKAYLFYIVIMLLLKLDLQKPFNSFVAERILKISYTTLSIGLISYMAREVSRSLLHQGFETDMLDQFWTDTGAYILMAAILYIIAVIFKRGIELQNENDLTV